MRRTLLLVTHHKSVLRESRCLVGDALKTVIVDAALKGELVQRYIWQSFAMGRQGVSKPGRLTKENVVK